MVFRRMGEFEVARTYGRRAGELPPFQLMLQRVRMRPSIGASICFAATVVRLRRRMRCEIEERLRGFGSRSIASSLYPASGS